MATRHKTEAEWGSNWSSSWFLARFTPPHLPLSFMWGRVLMDETRFFFFSSPLFPLSLWLQIYFFFLFHSSSAFPPPSLLSPPPSLLPLLSDAVRISAILEEAVAIISEAKWIQLVTVDFYVRVCVFFLFLKNFLFWTIKCLVFSLFWLICGQGFSTRFKHEVNAWDNGHITDRFN